jgi:N-acetylneuraminic acid mutarotase
MIMSQEIFNDSVEKNANALKTPLEWSFQKVPTDACQQVERCYQAGLGNGISIMFDGYTRRTWIFNGTKRSWGAVQISAFSPIIVAPKARKSYAMASLGEGKALLFGGFAHSNAPFYDDTWIFDLSSKNWTEVLTGVSTSNKTSPESRVYHAMASLGNGRAIMFGGWSGQHDFDDTWIFDQFTNNWTKISLPTTTSLVLQKSQSPKGRDRHAMAGLENGKVLMFGGVVGFGNGDYLSDTWIFDERISQWQKSNTSTESPKARDYHAMAKVEEGTIVLFGGYDGKGFFLGDTWTFTTKWNKVTSPSPKALQERSGHSMSSLNGEVLLYGGSNDNTILRDTWIYNKVDGWAQIMQDLTFKPPKARVFHSMATLKNGFVLMFGGLKIDGVNCDQLCNDTWVYSQVRKHWTKIETTHMNSPVSRIQHSMASIGTNKVLMFGGEACLNVLGDTWIFDFRNGNWALIEGKEASPKPRAQHAMAQLGKNTVILFGGWNGGSGDYDDTWKFDLTTKKWTQIKTSPSTKLPNARDTFSMASLGDGKILLFGGFDISLSRDIGDTWIFSQDMNESWVQIDTAHTSTDLPKFRDGYAMASFGENKVLMFGGQDNDFNNIDDTWLFHQETNTSWRWTLLGTQMAPRSQHAMATGSSNSVILFGGQANYEFGTNVASTYAFDTWVFSDGCPIGHGGSGCQACPVGTWKDNHLFTNCSKCPNKTKTSTTGAFQRESCLICDSPNAQTEFRSCFVDMFNDTFTPKWTCHGRYGPECQFECLGGEKSPCNNHGICFDGVNGDGSCNCDFFHKLDIFTGKCQAPVSGSLMGLVLLVFTTVITALRRSWKKYHKFNVRIMDMKHDKLTNSYNALKQDNSKLQKAWVVDKKDVNLKWKFRGEGKFNWRSETMLHIYELPSLPEVSKEIYFKSYKIFLHQWKNGENEQRNSKHIKKITCNYATGSLEVKTNSEDSSENSILSFTIELSKECIQAYRKDGKKLRDAFMLGSGWRNIYLGKGGYGEVLLAKWSGQNVAFKKMFPNDKRWYELGHHIKNEIKSSSDSPVIDSAGLHDISLAMLKNLEIEAMMRMRHKRIVTFHGVGEIFGPPNKNDDVPRVGIFVLMQLGCGGDLSHYLKNAYEKLFEFPWSKRIQFALDIAEGMEYIHSENFVHRDLKSMNVLLDENGRCMIADLGLTCKNVRSDPSIEPKFKNYDPNEAKGEDSNYLQDAHVGTKCWKVN